MIIFVFQAECKSFKKYRTVWRKDAVSWCQRHKKTGTIIADCDDKRTDKFWLVFRFPCCSAYKVFFIL